MLVLIVTFLVMTALAALFARLLLRQEAVTRQSPLAAIPDVAPMRIALERRMREGAEF